MFMFCKNWNALRVLLACRTRQYSEMHTDGWQVASEFVKLFCAEMS
jgi:hypothetical protein